MGSLGKICAHDPFEVRSSSSLSRICRASSTRSLARNPKGPGRRKMFAGGSKQNLRARALHRATAKATLAASSFQVRDVQNARVHFRRGFKHAPRDNDSDSTHPKSAEG